MLKKKSKKMFKKIIILFFAGVLCLGAFSCRKKISGTYSCDKFYNSMEFNMNGTVYINEKGKSLNIYYKVDGDKIQITDKKGKVTTYSIERNTIKAQTERGPITCAKINIY